MNLRTKLRKGYWFDAARHLWLRNVYYPMRVTLSYSHPRIPFLVNLDPACLYGPWETDRDAVYMVERKEVLNQLEALGCVDISKEVFSQSFGDKKARRTVCALAVLKEKGSE